ncbi:MAG: protein TolQ [Nitrospinales bacterium]
MPQNAVDDFQLSVVDLVIHSTPMAKVVLLVLLVFSILSWAIMLNKLIVYKIARREDTRFLSVFAKSESLNNIYNMCKELRHSPVARVFLTGYHELCLFQKLARAEGGVRPARPRDAVMSPRDLKGIGIALDKAINREIERLSHRLDFLATTGSTTPFIGLFGTVWGIMHSFRAIGAKGSASIGGVAPGIAEALIATAAGLLAAIPAVIFYNYLSNKVRLFTTRMDDFSNDFVFMAEKNFLR